MFDVEGYRHGQRLLSHDRLVHLVHTLNWVYDSCYMHWFLLLFILDILLVFQDVVYCSGHLHNLLFWCFTLGQLLLQHTNGSPQNLLILQRYFLWQVRDICTVYELTLNLVSVFYLRSQIVSVYHLGSGLNVRYFSVNNNLPLLIIFGQLLFLLQSFSVSIFSR